MNKLKKMALRQNFPEKDIFGLKQMFKMIDTNNSGYITFEELKDGLSSFGANLEELEIHDLMQAVSIIFDTII
ncbi:Calcium-binding EF-hand [Cynara cardunculus var. scolymus]|uniref:Calcium-binding EF-hand n=1 Tax=Cynara cardunculus var. scolymus TaxID=59895 RepID=A0A103YFM2_CYNCS|nr:Calcium-binding EF-hand [Cynara cardunculus var. scolymus]